MKRCIIAVLIIALITMTGCQGNTINVEGDSEITVDPDEVEVWVGVSITKPGAEEAQKEVNRIVDNIISGLKEKDIPEYNAETERMSLHEDRVWEDGSSKMVGWKATQMLKIKTKYITKASLIIDACIDNGANQIQNINYGLSEELEQKYKKEALAQATTNAKEKAETIADSLGVKLGNVKSVSESRYHYAPYVYAMETKVMGADMVEEASTILPQQVEVRGYVGIIYNIR